MRFDYDPVNACDASQDQSHMVPEILLVNYAPWDEVSIPHRFGCEERAGRDHGKVA